MPGSMQEAFMQSQSELRFVNEPSADPSATGPSLSRPAAMI